MRPLLTLLFAIVLLNLSATRVRTNDIASSSTDRINDEADFARSRKFPDNEKRIKRIQIRNQAGLDGKVHRIRLSHDDSEEDKPGIHAYGLPKKHLPDNGVIERVYVEGNRMIDDASRSGRLVEAYGMPKNDVNTNGFIERLPSSSADRRSERVESRNENVRETRSVREGSENKIKDKTFSSEAEDMVAQDAKVFRPLFVYRQQVAARERRKHSRNHRHAAHRPCYHRQY